MSPRQEILNRMNKIKVNMLRVSNNDPNLRRKMNRLVKRLEQYRQRLRTMN